MLIHSKIYKKLYPVTGWADLQALNEEDRKHLANLVREAPQFVKRYVLSETLAKRYTFDIDEEKLPEFREKMKNLAEKSKAAADKVERGGCLNDEEIKLVNDVVYAHKYNAVWSSLFNLWPERASHPKTK